MPEQKVPQNLMTGQVFMNLCVPKLEFSASRSLFSLFPQTLHIFFGQKLSKPNVWAKFTSQNLMPEQKLTPTKPNARARTSVPTFIRGCPPPPRVEIWHLLGIKMWLTKNLQVYLRVCHENFRRPPPPHVLLG